MRLRTVAVFILSNKIMDIDRRNHMEILSKTTQRIAVMAFVAIMLQLPTQAYAVMSEAQIT